MSKNTSSRRPRPRRLSHPRFVRDPAGARATSTEELMGLTPLRFEHATELLRRNFNLTETEVTQVGDSGFHYRMHAGWQGVRLGEVVVKWSVPKFVAWGDAKAGRF